MTGTKVRPSQRVAAISQPIVGPHIVLGLGLGGFFDGIVLHQILQWHHILTSNGYPPTTVNNLKLSVSRRHRWCGRAASV